MKHVTIREFPGMLDECMNHARIGAVTVGDNADDPDLVMISYEVYRQLCRGQVKAGHVSQMPEECREAIASAVFDEAAANTEDLP